MVIKFALLIASACLMASSAKATDVVHGPVDAEVVQVIDGDTVEVRAHILLGLNMETHVRLAGVDAPEMHGACESERSLALKARDLVERRLASGEARLYDIKRDKYGGRVVARLETIDGKDLTSLLIKSGLGHPYRGGHKAPWC